MNRSRWSIEAMLVFGIPLATVIAGLLTVIIAVQNRWEPVADRSDRFAGVATQSEQ